ncbi:hypothetical protein PIB30_029535 [Stylosanthes scabra]|uniref:Uncharacterized protein n=1 Tax=Stylosanthes scabra TaxID=79078 RepID=A0ABU6UA54_9FABA|nr:hypothetical protein [Stylosanthes scabra]
MAKFKRSYGYGNQNSERSLPQSKGKRVVQKWVEIRKPCQGDAKTGDDNGEKNPEWYRRKEIEAAEFEVEVAEKGEMNEKTATKPIRPLLEPMRTHQEKPCMARNGPSSSAKGKGKVYGPPTRASPRLAALRAQATANGVPEAPTIPVASGPPRLSRKLRRRVKYFMERKQLAPRDAPLNIASSSTNPANISSDSEKEKLEEEPKEENPEEENSKEDSGEESEEVPKYVPGAEPIEEELKIPEYVPGEGAAIEKEEDP